MNKQIAALLFVKGKKGLRPGALSSVTELSTPEARKALTNFMKEWNKQEHGFNVVNYGDHFKFVTSEDHKDIISDLVTIEKKQKLSTAAIEAVGIIAYKQPITKSQVNDIRGVASEAVVNTLLVKGLIEEAGIQKTPGNPVLYKISSKFYDYFNIQSLKELPKLAEFDEDDTEDFELFSSQRSDE